MIKVILDAINTIVLTAITIGIYLFSMQMMLKVQLWLR